MSADKSDDGSDYGSAYGPDYGIETRAVHAGTRPDPTTGARATPIYQTTSYVFDDVDHAASLFNLQTFGYIYSRLTNPTVSALEEKIANLENGRAAVACASGHAAQFLAFFTLMEPGDHIVASKFLYGGSVTQFTKSFSKLGWHADLIDPNDTDLIEATIRDNTKAIFVEALANPGGVVVDLEPLAEIARAHRIPLIVDNTLATPVLCQPFQWGADIIIHSATKFIGGHGNSMGGIIVESGKFDWFASGKFPGMTEPEPAYHGLTFAETFGDFGYTTKTRAVALRDFGPSLSPTNAFNLITGCETLPLRMRRHCDNAMEISQFLESHPKVAWVSYAGLPSSPYHTLAQKYLIGGFGSIFTFGVKGGFEAGTRVVEASNLFSHLANVGDTRSLIIHPASTTHRQLSSEQREAAGAEDDTIRLSIGIETAADLIADLDQALAKA